MNERERAVAFIDEANLAKQASKLGIEIDYKKLLSYLRNEHNLVRAYLYTGIDLSLQYVKDFILMLKRTGYRVVHYRGVPRSDGSVKANLDVYLVVDMLSMADWYDTAILISGDGDFAPAIEAISRKGVRIEVISLEEHTSDDIIDLADHYTDLRDLVPQIQYQRGLPVIETVNDIQNVAQNDEVAKELFISILKMLKADDLPYRFGDANKQMQQADPSYDIRRTTFKKFLKLVEYFEQQGIIKVGIDADGKPALAGIYL